MNLLSVKATNLSIERRDRTITEMLRVLKVLQTEFNMQHNGYVMNEVLSRLLFRT